MSRLISIIPAIEKNFNPYTGDNSQLAALVPICIISLAAIIALVVLSGKRKK